MIYQHLYRYRVPKLTEGEALRCMERDPVQVGWRGGLWFLSVNCDGINVVHDIYIYIQYMIVMCICIYIYIFNNIYIYTYLIIYIYIHI